MKISVLGTGSVGQALAARLAGLGHDVFMGTRDVAASMQKTESDSWGNNGVGAWIGSQPSVKLLPFKEAVEKGSDLVVFAMNGKSAFDCLRLVGEELLKEKIFIDVSNPLDFSQGFPPSLFVSNTESLAEKIQSEYPQIKLVKTLNTMSNPVMVNPDLIPGDHSVFISGNDESSKKFVAELLMSFGWKKNNIIDLGDLSTARGTEMILPLWVRLFGKYQTPFFNFHVKMAEPAKMA